VFAIETHEKSENPAVDCDCCAFTYPKMNETFVCERDFYDELDCYVVEVEGRLALVAALLLTIVTFKVGFANLLPRVSYLTVLDRYYIMNIAFLFVLTLLMTAMPFLQYYFVPCGSTAHYGLDIAAGLVLGLCWGLFHIVFFWNIRRYVKRTNQLLGNVIGATHVGSATDRFAKKMRII
jgi:hypothetical protein